MSERVIVVFYRLDDLLHWLFRIEELDEEGYEYMSSITKSRGKTLLMIGYIDK